MIKTYYIEVQGKVQGVGFKYYTLNKALELNIKGTVKNARDDIVEIICQGSEKQINKFISEIQKGPVLSVITNIIIEEQTKSNNVKFIDFKIIS
jgi:acylphosphatase